MQNSAVTSNYPVDIIYLLKLAVERKSSDLHLVTASSPLLRINSAIQRLGDLPIMKNDDIKAMLYSMLSEEQITVLNNTLELDFSYSLSGVSRFRGNVIFQRGTLSVVLRVVPFQIPAIDDLGLPQDLKRLCGLARGLVLVTGPTGSGKSTTLAAMLEYINTNQACNIVTIEDPIEFLHQHKTSTVRQREIGIDTLSYGKALRQVLRHDPDVIMIGEMRDRDSIATAISAAETGHLVLSTLHTQTAPLTISRIVDSFPDTQKLQIRQQLANSLRAVISQQLVPTANKVGRVASIEYMIDTPAVCSLIRDGKEHQLYSIIQTGSRFGMQTMDQALISLIRSGRITIESAHEYCVDKSELDRLLTSNKI